MSNTPNGELLLAARREAEEALRRLDPVRYSQVEHWLDRELYGGLYGHGGVDTIPLEHLPEVKQLLRARSAVYRAQKSGAIRIHAGHSYDSEAGNERMAQAIESCLEYLGDAPVLPPGKPWDNFWPTW